MNQDFIYTNHGLKKLFKVTESENYSFCKRTKNRKLHSFINKYKFIFVKHFQFFFFKFSNSGFFVFKILKYKRVKDPLEAVLVAALHGLHFAYEVGF